jgi:hypothetical protein
VDIDTENEQQVLAAFADVMMFGTGVLWVGDDGRLKHVDYREVPANDNPDLPVAS